MWRILREYFSGSIETHGTAQDFYLGADLMPHRHDYNLCSAGIFGVDSGHRITARRSEYGFRLVGERIWEVLGVGPLLEMLMVSRHPEGEFHLPESLLSLLSSPKIGRSAGGGHAN